MPKICNCRDCPVTCQSEMAEQILNYGCLPGATEAYELFKKSGRLWGCHSQPDQICGGILRLVIEKGETVDFSKLIIQQQEY